MKYSPTTWGVRLLASLWRAIALAALPGCVAFGCGGDGPTGPDAASIPELFGDQLFKADGSSVDVGVLANTALIGIYFASPGCPACGAFNPTLVHVYNQLMEGKRSFEVVLVTQGVPDAALFEYMVDSGMPWLTLSSQSSKANALIQRFNVRWVPTLIIIDGDGNTVSRAGREEVTRSGTGAYDGWLAAAAGS